MARKRGGLAGLYDRNKGLIRTGATIGASLLGGPMAGAATGAAFRGLDREGKRGIGFDIGQGLRGGLEGYAIGQGTQGVKGLLTGGGRAAAAVPTASPSATSAPGFKFDFQGIGAPLDGAGFGGSPALPPMSAKIGITPGIAGNMGAPAQISGSALQVAKAPNILSKAPDAKSLLSRAGTFAKENKDLLTMAGKGIQQTLPDPASDAALMNAETTRMRLDEERRQMQVEEERRRRIAELLMPLFRQQFPQYAGS